MSATNRILLGVAFATFVGPAHTSPPRKDAIGLAQALSEPAPTDLKLLTRLEAWCTEHSSSAFELGVCKKERTALTATYAKKLLVFEYTPRLTYEADDSTFSVTVGTVIELAHDDETMDLVFVGSPPRPFSTEGLTPRQQLRKVKEFTAWFESVDKEIVKWRVHVPVEDAERFEKEARILIFATAREPEPRTNLRQVFSRTDYHTRAMELIGVVFLRKDDEDPVVFEEVWKATPTELERRFAPK
jgi:hypothetical protein